MTGELKYGDKIYRVFNGRLETAVFEKECTYPDCTLPHWECHEVPAEDGELPPRRFTCSPGMYLATEKAAWERYLSELRESVPRIYERVEAEKQDLRDVVAAVLYVENKVRELS